jgi:hypothetical protein
MKTLLGIVALIVVTAFSISVRTAQDIVYGTPQAQATKTKATIVYFHIQVDPSNMIEVGIKDESGKIQSFRYPNISVPALDTNAEVGTLIGQLNTANLSTAHTTPVSTGSLKYRIADILCRDFAAQMPSGSCSVQ